MEMRKKCVTKGESGGKSKCTLSPMQNKMPVFKQQWVPNMRTKKWRKMGGTGGRYEESLLGAQTYRRSTIDS